MSADDQLVEVCGLLGGEAVETQIVQNQQVRAKPESTDGRREDSGRGVRELQAR